MSTASIIQEVDEFVSQLEEAGNDEEVILAAMQEYINIINELSNG